MEKEEDNKYDVNALGVFKDGKLVGHVPRTEKKFIQEWLD